MEGGTISAKMGLLQAGAGHAIMSPMATTDTDHNSIVDGNASVGSTCRRQGNVPQKLWVKKWLSIKLIN